MKGLIYIIKHPETLEVVYVGQTTKSLEERFRGHISAAINNTTRWICTWFKDCLDKGLTPIIEAIAEVDSVLLDEQEKFYIKFYKAEGYSLLNLTNGGSGTTFRIEHQLIKFEIEYPEGVLIVTKDFLFEKENDFNKIVELKKALGPIESTIHSLDKKEKILMKNDLRTRVFLTVMKCETEISSKVSTKMDK